MSKAKAKELNVKGGNGPACHCYNCDPRPDRLPAWKVWDWALKHPGISVWR
jgi:hypothetical protein